MKKIKHMKNITIKKMNTKGIFGMTAAVLAGAVLVGSTVCASPARRSDNLSSCGAIHYDGDKVVIDSAHLFTLADGMDSIETLFKGCIVDALAEIGTSVQQDGSISYGGEAADDPQQVAFRNLVAGILQSQSVAHLSETQASGSQGLLYYKFATNNLLEVTSDNTGMPVYIVPATEDNLTVQTAAWVDGHCLEGNGSDNYYFYQKGFIEGYAAKLGMEVEYTYDETGKIESAKLVRP